MVGGCRFTLYDSALFERRWVLGFSIIVQPMTTSLGTTHHILPSHNPINRETIMKYPLSFLVLFVSTSLMSRIPSGTEHVFRGLFPHHVERRTAAQPRPLFAVHGRGNAHRYPAGLSSHARRAWACEPSPSCTVSVQRATVFGEAHTQDQEV